MAVRPEGLLRELNGAMKALTRKTLLLRWRDSAPCCPGRESVFHFNGVSHFTNLSLESVYVHYVKGRFIPKMHLEVRGWLEDGGGCDDAQLYPMQKCF